jgi:hypothetical protein
MKALSITFFLVATTNPGAVLAAHDEPNKAVRDYMQCVSLNAILLEPSGESPSDVAMTAVFICQPEERAVLGYLPDSAEQPREKAMHYGISQFVVSRQCSKFNSCSTVLVPPKISA